VEQISDFALGEQLLEPVTCCAGAFSEEAPKPEDTTDGAKSAEVHEGEAATATKSTTSKPTRDQQTVMTNIESLYFADTYLFQG